MGRIGGLACAAAVGDTIAGGVLAYPTMPRASLAILCLIRWPTRVRRALLLLSLGRRFLGIELNSGYVALAEEAMIGCIAAPYYPGM
jgi:hypothetical protein